MTVAWILDYPVEWMTDIPEPLRGLPKLHPATWMPVLLGEFVKEPLLRLHVLVLRKSIAADYSFERNGVTFHVLKTRGGLRAPSLFWVDSMVIGRCLRRIAPDLVHAWGTERGAALVASRLGYPYVVTMQGLLTWYGEVLRLTVYERFAAWIERVSLRQAKVVTTESVFAVEFLRQRFANLLVHQAEHAPNWLFHRLERRPRTAPVRFITVGTFCHRKGSDLLLKALNELLPEMAFELVVVGSPDVALINSLKPQLSPRLWERIKFKSHLRPAEVAQEMASATIAVLPTRADTSPNAVKEAVVAGLPVVASRVGGIPDYVFPGENGLLVPPDDLPALVEALRKAVRHPLFGGGRVEPAALARTREYLSPARMARLFGEAYRAALAEARR
jgi:glycosyltransferase involved in cell wall biosynthesis